VNDSPATVAPVDAARRSLARLGDRGGLLHREAAGVVDAVHQRSGVVERKRDNGGPSLQRERERHVVEVGYHVVDGKGTIGLLTDGPQIPVELVGRTLPRAEASETARVRHRSHELRGREDTHAGLDDRSLDADQIAERRMQHESLQSASAARTGHTVRPPCESGTRCRFDALPFVVVVN